MSGINKPAALANSEYWGSAAPGGYITQPSDAFIQAGWPLSTTPPSRQYFNWICQYNNQAVRYLLTQGLPAWDSAETYQIGAVIIGSDNVIRMALVANAGQNPTTSTDWSSPLVPNSPDGDSTMRAANTSFVKFAVTAQAGLTLSSAESFATAAANAAQNNAETFATGAASTAQSNAEVYASAQATAAQSNAETYASGLITTYVTDAIGKVSAGVGSGTVDTSGGAIVSNIPVIPDALYDVECVGQIVTGATGGVVGSNISGNGGGVSPTGIQVQIGISSGNSVLMAYANCASMASTNILAGSESGAVTLKGEFFTGGGCTSVNFNMFTTAGSMTIQNMVVKLTRVQ